MRIGASAGVRYQVLEGIVVSRQADAFVARVRGRLSGPVLSPVAAAPQGAGNVAAAMSGAAASPADRLDAAMGQIGLTQCAAVVDKAARFLFEDGEVNFTVQPLGPDANRWPTVIMIEGSHPGTASKTRLSSLTVSPGPAGCAGFYEQVIAWPTPCEQLKATTFAAFTNTRIVLRNVKVSELGPGLQIYLMPGATGCVSVKKELFH